MPMCIHNLKFRGAIWALEFLPNSLQTCMQGQLVICRVDAADTMCCQVICRPGAPAVNHLIQSSCKALHALWRYIMRNVVSTSVLVPSNSTLASKTLPAAEAILLPYTGAKALGCNGSEGLIIPASVWLAACRASCHSGLQLASLSQQRGCIL